MGIQTILPVNNPKDYKTFGSRKKSLFCLKKKNQNFAFLQKFFFFPYFLFKFIFLVYECTFISTNHITYSIRYLEQTGKKMQQS